MTFILRETSSFNKYTISLHTHIYGSFDIVHDLFIVFSMVCGVLDLQVHICSKPLLKHFISPCMTCIFVFFSSFWVSHTKSCLLNALIKA